MKKSTWTLVAILVALVMVTYLVLQRPGESSASADGGKMLVEYDSAAIDKIDIRSPNGSLTLEKQAGVWMLTAPLRYKADESTVAAALGSGRKITVATLVSTNPQKQQLFQVDSAGTIVRMFDRGIEKTAFHIGKPGPSYTESYVRREGSDEVHLAAGLAGSPFMRRANEWRDKSILKVDQNAIREVTFRFGDTAFTVSRTDSVWRIGNDAAKTDVATGVINTLANFQADEFIDTTVSDMPPMTAQIEVAGAQIGLFWKKDGDRYYVRHSSSPQLFQVYSWRASQLLKRKKDFLGTAM